MRWRFSLFLLVCGFGLWGAPAPTLADVSLCWPSLGNPALVPLFMADKVYIPALGSTRSWDVQGPWELVGEIYAKEIPSSPDANPAPPPWGRPVILNPYWTLTADLRDASCPTCQFPAFAFPQSFDCLGDCSDGHWTVSNGSASAEMIPKALSPVPWARAQGIRLELDTTRAPVSCNQEYNLFVFGGKPFGEPLMSFGGELSPLLGARRELEVRFYHQIEEVVQPATCPAPFAVASTLVGVQLRQTPGLLLNYQLITFDSRGAVFNGDWWSFQAAKGERVYGVDDSLETYGIAPLEPHGEGKLIVLDVAARLKLLVTQNPVGLDRDPAHWRIDGFYSGSYTNGQAKIRSFQSWLGLARFSDTCHDS